VPDGSRLVVRAAPAAATADSAALGRDLDVALERLARPGSDRPRRESAPRTDRPRREAATSGQPS
jgi:hypothetical protein